MAVLIGEEFRFAKGKERVCWFPTSQDALYYLKQHPVTDVLVLLKGSNSNKIWLLAEAL